jgi:ribosomal protein S12 methylthiotransferase
MEKRHIPLELAKERYNLVMQQQKLISRKFNRDLLGRYREVLIDTVKPGKLTSRLSSQAPDIDGKVFVSTSGGAFAAGQLLTVRITGTGAYNLLASEKGN